VADLGGGALVGRVEGREVRDLVAPERRTVRRGIEDRPVDGVVAVGLAGERCRSHQIVPIGCVEDHRLLQRELVAGERAGLVRAEQVDRGHLLEGVEPRHDGLASGQPVSPDGHGHSQHGWQRRWDAGDEQDQAEHDRLREPDAAHQLHGDHGDDQHGGDRDEEVADAQHGSAEVGDALGLLDHRRGLCEPGAHAGRGDDADHLTLLDRGARVRRVAPSLGHRDRFSGESRLVYLQAATGRQRDIGGHDRSDLDADDVAGDEILGRHGPPGAVAQHVRLGGELLLERVDDVGGLVLLPEADDPVDHEQERDDRTVVPPLHDDAHDHGELEHPRDRPPEVVQELSHRAPALVHDPVGPVFLEPTCRLLARETPVQVGVGPAHRSPRPVLAARGRADHRARRATVRFRLLPTGARAVAAHASVASPGRPAVAGGHRVAAPRTGERRGQRTPAAPAPTGVPGLVRRADRQSGSAALCLVTGRSLHGVIDTRIVHLPRPAGSGPLGHTSDVLAGRTRRRDAERAWGVDAETSAAGPDGRAVPDIVPSWARVRSVTSTATGVGSPRSLSRVDPTLAGRPCHCPRC
jgi:hypothetical protein